MYQVPVKIKKSAIKEVCGHPPRLVTGQYTVAGSMHSSGTVVFCGFQGVKVATDVWGGHYRFDDVGHKDPADTITAATLNSCLAEPSSIEPRREGALTAKGTNKQK